MKSRKALLAAAVVLCLGLVGTPASWAASLTFQGVTFTTAVVDSNTFSLSLTGLQSPSGDWAGIDGIQAFGLKDLGTTFAATTLSLTGWTATNEELNASSADGCSGGGAPGAFCFSHDGGTLSFGGANTLTLNIDHSGVAPDLTSPHLKVLFTGADVPNGHGSLLSANLVPVPGTLLMFGLGFVLLIAWYQWYKRPTSIAGAAA